MFYENEIEINGTKYIRADKVVDYVRKLEKETEEDILKNPIKNEYKMTKEEYFDVSDLFDCDIGEKKYIEMENVTIHALNKDQFKKINKILNCYYDLAYMRLESKFDEI